MINKKRLIITSIISIMLVSILFLGSTYSIFTIQEIDEDVNVYKTGDLNIEYNSNNIQINSNKPMIEEEAYKIIPTRLTVTNTGNVTYSFDVILNDTSSTPDNTINYKYIMTKVGYLEAKRLKNCTNNIIKEDIILLPGKSVDIDVRIWIADDVENTEIGKSFYAKLSVDGLAVYNDNQEIDNSLLSYSLRYLNTVNPGDYVKYVGDSKNGCDDTNLVNGWTSCSGKNSNYLNDENMGYCHSESSSFKVNGWRIGYIEDGSVHLISAGAIECMCTNSDGTVSNVSCSNGGGLNVEDYYKQIDNLDNMALKYCNKDYVKGGICNNTTTWAMDDLDFQKITDGSLITTCYNTPSATGCGIGNDLIDNGSYYHFAKQFGTGATNYIWNSSNLTHSYGSRSYIAGVRPVISLEESVHIIGGSGSYIDPYLIAN